MNRLDQRNPNTLDSVAKVLDYYHERWWLRVLVHATYIFAIFKEIGIELKYPENGSLFVFWLYFTTNIIATYAIFYYLIPQFLLKGRYVLFFSIVALWYFFVFSYFTRLYLSEVLPPNRAYLSWFAPKGNLDQLFGAINGGYNFWEHFINLSFSQQIFNEFRARFGIFILVKSFQYFFEYNIKQKQLNELNYSLEAQFLQSQLNPHFLFNSLNNIYGLMVSRRPETQTAIAQLQSLLKQSFDETAGDKVSLLTEVEYLKNYINLERIRHDQNVEINFEVVEKSLENYTIAPRVLLPFVENAFKHGLHDNLDHARIQLSMAIKNNQLDFKIENTKPTIQVKKATVGGIGLVNIKRRLALLYPTHSLNIQDDPKKYEVNLSLSL